MIRNCKPGHVALTFDDGPSVYTKDLVDFLDSKQVHATFFVNGQNFLTLNESAEAQEALKAAYQSGHQIASHTYSHQDLNTLDGDDFDREIVQLEQVVQDLIGVRPAFIRPPYGNANEDTVEKLENRGYSVIEWSTDSKDYETHDLGSEMENIRESITGDDEGYIILTHDVYDQTTTELAAAIIDYVHEKGLQFATVADCLDKSPYQ